MSDRYNDQLIEVIEANSSEWIEEAPAVLGDLEGNVSAGGSLVYARLSTGFVVVAVNYIAPLIFNLHVLVGRSRSQPGFFQVIRVREVYENPQSEFVKYHHEQHEYDDTSPGPDIVWVRRKQLLSLTILVLDAANFIVRLYGEHGQTQTGIKTIATQEIDLSSYVPTAGAKYITIQSDNDGVVTVKDGTAVGSIAELTDSDIPTPDTGNVYRGCVLLFETQTELLNSQIRVAWPIGTVANSVGNQINTAPTDAPLAGDKFGFWDIVDDLLKSITYQDLIEGLIGDLKNIVVQYNVSTNAVDFSSFEPLANGDPSDPQIVFDAFGNVIMTPPV